MEGLMKGLVGYFNKGGPMMYLLLVVAVLALAIILERIFTLFIKARTNPQKLVNTTIEKIEGGGIEDALEFLASHRSPIAKVLYAGLEKVERGRAVVEEAMTQKAAQEFAFLDRGMIYLSASATVAPILGFLGTVTGMIKAFEAIALAGEVEPTLVSKGISEALITTATGLLIAAPVSIFYAVFSSTINNYSRRIEEASNAFIEYLLEKGILQEVA
jgi:biopolymer transport protein ExbB